MNQIKHMELRTFKTFVGELLSASENVAKKYGVEIELQYTSELSRQYFIKLGVIEPSVARANYIEHAREVGLPDHSFGKTVQSRKHTYRIIGCIPRRRYSIKLLREDGKRFMFTPSAVQSLLEDQNASAR